MNNKKMYEATVAIKNVLMDSTTFMEELGSSIIDENLSDFVHKQYGTLREKSIYLKTAFVAVLWCGSFRVDGSFNMPATRDVMDSFKHVSKKIKKGNRLESIVYTGEGYYLEKLW